MDTGWTSPFWQAFAMPESSRVCGLRVPPLSVWHVFALEQIGNSYIVGGTIDAGEALQLLTVATQTRAKFLNVFHVERRRNRVLRRVKRAMLWNGFGRGSDAVLACREYVEQSMRVAGRWQRKEAKPCAVPHALHILQAAVRFGVCYPDAWDMPYATARAMFDVLAEQRGDDSIQTSRQQELDERMAAEAAGVSNG